MRLLLAAAALALAAPVAAKSAPEWRPVDAETGQIRDIEGLSALAEAFPDSGSVRLRLLNAQLGAGDIEGVLASLAWLKERGYVFSAGAQAQVPQLLGEEHAATASALLIPEAEVIESSRVVSEVPAEAGLIESVVNPGGGLAYAATSISHNVLMLYAPGVGWVTDAIEGVNDLSGVISEPGDDMGWAASSNLDGSEEDEPLFNGLVGLTGNRGESVLVPAPEGVALSDLSVGPDATVFASDPLNGGIYRKPPGTDASLSALVEPGTFRSPQGSALSADGDRLYVSDYRYGLAFIDIESGAVSRLPSDVPVLLDGIDGLWRHENELIAVQNGTSPMRISAFTLSEDGERIVGARVLEQAHSEWTEPLGGNLSGDTLVYVGTGQWDRYDKGVLKEGMEAIPTQIRRLNL